MHKTAKILIIRFSSFGDIVQAMSVLAPLKEQFPRAEVHWLSRSDNVEILEQSPYQLHVWSFKRESGLIGLVRLSLELRAQNFTHIYDAHSNIRSRIVSCILSFLRSVNFLRRSKQRLKRFLLFGFGINKFPRPFKGMLSYLAPLTRWGVDPSKNLYQNWNFSESCKKKCETFVNEKFVALAPSAAWDLKRWPLESWKELIRSLADRKILILAGPADHFCDELQAIDPENVLNLAGKLSLVESCYIVSKAELLVSADTGLLHVADLLGKKAIALMGPTAFGFPTSHKIKTLEVSLPCRPCSKDGRGRCIQKIEKRCMHEIRPDWVHQTIEELSE